MIPRILEPEVMDSPDDASDYDSMDHSVVNARFVDDLLLAYVPGSTNDCNLCENEYITILDLGTGTAQIPILLCQQMPRARILATDAAESMLKLAKRNIYLADLNDSIRLAHVDCKRLTFAADTFDIVMSNSIVHHIPTPEVIFSESVRVAKNGGTIFLRDLARPADKNTLDSLVATYAADCNSHQRQLFADSLHAALTVDEVRQIVVALGFSPKTVEMTSDRHWTWAAVKRS